MRGWGQREGNEEVVMGRSVTMDPQPDHPRMGNYRTAAKRIFSRRIDDRSRRPGKLDSLRGRLSTPASQKVEREKTGYWRSSPMSQKVEMEGKLGI